MLDALQFFFFLCQLAMQKYLLHACWEDRSALYTAPSKMYTMYNKKDGRNNEK